MSRRALTRLLPATPPAPARYPRRSGRPTPRAFATVALAASLVAAGTVAAHGASAASRTHVVSYAGLSVRVPSSWPVIDLTADPHACVRLDVHAVYLGASGTQQDCPAHLVGRTETVQLAPATAAGSIGPLGAVGSGAVTARAGSVPAAAVSAVGHQIAVVAAGSGAQLTVTWGSDEPLAHQIAASAVRRYTVRTPVPAAEGVPLYPAGASSTLLSGFAFDTCAAPSVASMHAWKRSSYSGVAVYIGGANRACGDGNLSASWVSSVVNGQHWKLLPIYVGLQAPCSGSRFSRVSYSTSTAYAQGKADAADAVADARRFRLTAGTGIYSDMEGYGVSSSCTAGVLSYLSGWTNGLHAAGYLAGVYSSGSSGIYDLGRNYSNPAYTMPDLVWSARWDGVASTYERNLSSNEWVTHQRVKQYLGDHDETWGGATIDIDSDYADAAMSSVGYRVTVTRATAARQRPVVTATALATVPASATVTAVCWIAGASGGASGAWLELIGGSFLPASSLDLHGQTPPRCGLLYTTWIAVNARSGPGAQYPAKARIPAGGGVWIVCQAPGLKVRTSMVWDRLRTGLWVADYWMNTPGASTWSTAIPRC